MSQMVYTFGDDSAIARRQAASAEHDRTISIIHPDGHLQSYPHLSIWHIARPDGMSHLGELCTSALPDICPRPTRRDAVTLCAVYRYASF
jgi:hypothetical protein